MPRIKKRASAQDFLDVEAEASADEIEEASEPGASDGDGEEEEEVEEEIEGSDVGAEAINLELLRQRDLLFQWHLVRPGRDVRFCEYQQVGGDANMTQVLANTPHGDLTLTIAKENLVRAALTRGCKLGPLEVFPEVTAAQLEKRLRSLARGTRRFAPKPRARRGRKPSTKTTDADNASGKEKANGKNSSSAP